MTPENKLRYLEIMVETLATMTEDSITHENLIEKFADLGDMIENIHEDGYKEAVKDIIYVDNNSYLLN